MRKAAVFVLILGLLAAPAAAEPRSAQSSGRRSNKARVIGTIAGAAGGFVLGIFAGLTWFDDATNSDRKVWATAIGFAAGGAVGGYFAGRAVGGSQTGAAPAVRPGTDSLASLPGLRLALPRSEMPSRAATARLATALAGSAP